ncbi:hypothetical protein ACFPRL_34510 [Pseudoclavibacter helvolus]
MATCVTRTTMMDEARTGADMGPVTTTGVIDAPTVESERPRTETSAEDNCAPAGHSGALSASASRALDPGKRLRIEVMRSAAGVPSDET